MATLKSQFSIRWGDLDALGHVNHLVYLSWLEEARIVLLSKIGLTGGPGHEDPIGPILASLSCDYRAPLAYPGEVRVESWVSALGRSSLTIDYHIFLESAEAGDAQQVAVARSVIIAFDYQRSESAPLSEAQRARVTEWLGEAATLRPR